MKKAILGSLALAASLFFSISAYAEPATGKMVSTLSISEAMQQRAAALHSQPKGLNAAVAEAVQGGYHDTFIVVINYTKETIRVVWPVSTVTVTERTATKYSKPNDTSDTYVSLQNANGVPFWNGYMQFHDLAEVYVVNGKFDVRITR